MKSLVRIKPIPQAHLTEHVQTLTERACMQRQHHVNLVQKILCTRAILPLTHELHCSEAIGTSPYMKLAKHEPELIKGICRHILSRTLYILGKGASLISGLDAFLS